MNQKSCDIQNYMIRVCNKHNLYNVFQQLIVFCIPCPLSLSLSKCCFLHVVISSFLFFLLLRYTKRNLFCLKCRRITLQGFSANLFYQDKKLLSIPHMLFIYLFIYLLYFSSIYCLQVYCNCNLCWLIHLPGTRWANTTGLIYGVHTATTMV